MADCPNCGTNNPEGFRFCGACGTALRATCPNCGADAPSGFRFCGQCATPLNPQSSTPAATAISDPSPSQPTVERRLVSVLFADLVGFTGLSETRDAEEVRDLLSRYFNTARDVIDRYGGNVEKFIGDAVMAVWGTPVAHEDDAERAVRAGLELVDAIGALGRQVDAPDLRLRAGVLTGEVAVTIGAEGQGMVAGDLVNTASRLQTAAAPGAVLVGKATFQAANKAIAFENAGAHALKGKELPVEAWRALRAIAGHQGFKRVEGMEPPFVGRDEELRVLKEALHATGRERRPRLVSVMGIGGIGKSRLAWELFKYIDGLVETIFWHVGRCPAYGDGLAFWALGEMVRMRARITESEDVESTRDKLHRAVEQYVPNEDERRWVEPRLAHLLGLGEPPSGEREELFAAWRSFFEHIAEQGPTVMVFEDLQWADPGLIDFIEHTLEWARGAPLLVVTLARPELSDKRPSWGAGQRNFTSIHLQPLAEADMRKLLAGVAAGLPDHVVEQVVERAEGVPLYGVETLRMLVDQGYLVAGELGMELVRVPERLEVSPSLHSLIAARLDSLEGDDRALLQTASVLGKTFTLEALSALTRLSPAVLEPRLSMLVRRELLSVESDPWSPERGQYGFVQGLIREIAYGSLSKRDRGLKHTSAARYFAGLEDDELAGVVAAHYIEAWRATSDGEEGDVLVAQASASLVSAADRAISLGTPVQALAYLEQALEIPSESAARVPLLERAADAAKSAALSEIAERYLHEAIEWYTSQKDRSAATSATAKLANIFSNTGRAQMAIDMLEETGRHQMEEASDRDFLAVADGLSTAFMLQSKPTEALRWADRSLATAERLDLVPRIVSGLINRGVALHDAGRWREGLATLTAALGMAEEHEALKEQLDVLGNLSFLLEVSDPSRGLVLARRGLELARKLGLRADEVVIGDNACWCAFSVGEWDWARAAITDLYSQNEPSYDEVVWLGTTDAVLSAMCGDFARANELLRLARPMAEGSETPQDMAAFLEAEAWVALAEGRLKDAYSVALATVDADPGPSGFTAYTIACRAALWQGDRTGAAAAFDKLQERQVHSPWLTSYDLTVQAGLHAVEGRHDEALTLYDKAAGAWRDLGLSFELALSLLDCVVLVKAQEPEVQSAAEEGRAIFDRLGAKPLLKRLDAARAKG